MAMNEYRRRAVECLLLADDITDPKNKLLLVAMAQAWLKLAQRAEENLTPDFINETVLSPWQNCQAVQKPPHTHPPATTSAWR
jgi:hypothetical protein